MWADDDGFPWATISDMPSDGVLLSTNRHVSKLAEKRVFTEDPAPDGTLLMSFKLTIGKVCRLGIDCYFNEAIIAIRSPFPETDEFLFRFLPSLAILGSAKGAIKGSTLNADSLSNLMIPVPPLPEQRRIVERLDEMMGLFDVLEEAIEIRNDLAHRFADAACDLRSSG